MMEQPESRRAATDDDVPSPAAQVRALVDEVRVLAEAEVDYARARLLYSGGILRSAGALALLALLAFSGAVIALVVGLLLIVDHYAGPVAATVAIFMLFVVIAALLGLRARAVARKLKFEGEDGDGRT